MIHLITGLPGHGKTHYAVELLVKRLNDDQDALRPCFANINDLNHVKLNSNPLDDPIDWYNLPDSSIIVIDEAQRWFRPRANGATVPEHVSRLETHRHQGFDIIMITQGPKLIDANVRALTDRHTHCFTPFGSKMRQLFKYEGVNDNPLPSTVKVHQGEKTVISSKVFGYYKSASDHTKKMRLPIKVIAGTGLALVAAIFFVGKTAIAFTSDPEPALEPVAADPVPIEKPEPGSEPTSKHPARTSFGLPAYSQEEQLQPWRYAGGIRGPINTYWLIDPHGQTVRLDDFSAYRTTGDSVILLDSTGSEVATIRDRRLLQDLKF